MAIRTLSLACVAAFVFGTQLAPARAELVGYWSFDAGNAADESTNGNNGTVGTAITFDPDTPLGSGLSGQSHGTGSTNVVTVPTSTSLESIDDQMTLAFWMKAVPGNNWVRIFQHGTESSSNLPTWLVDRFGSTNRTNVRVDTTAQFNQNIATGGADTFDGTWHQLLYVLDNGSWRKYVDGVESSGSYNHGAGLSNTRPLYIFGRNGGGEYVGQLDDIGLWSDALSTAYARSTYTLPVDLGLDYDLGDVMDLWATYEAGAGSSVNIDGIGWTYTASLPGSTTAGDAYKGLDGNLYVVLGAGSGLVGVPEPSTLAMLAGLAGVALLGLLRRRS